MRRSSLALVLLLAACGMSAPRAVEGNAIDPAVAAALADPLMTDPDLSVQANIDTLRPSDQPFQAPIPLGVPTGARPDTAPTLGARVKAVSVADRTEAFAGCDLLVNYGQRWADRLPTDLALPDGAQVTEAAGSDTEGCRLRVVSFVLGDSPDAALSRYRDLARRAGYATGEARETGATVLSARRPDGAAFVATIGPGEAGSAIDLMANRGR